MSIILKTCYIGKVGQIFKHFCFGYGLQKTRLGKPFMKVKIALKFRFEMYKVVLQSCNSIL